jgi:hypothetical protein
MITFSEKKLHKIGRADQVIKEYFSTHPAEKQVQAKKLMPLFVEQGIFYKQNKDGLQIRLLLRQLEKENEMALLEHAHVVWNAANRNWYFTA